MFQKLSRSGPLTAVPEMLRPSDRSRVSWVRWRGRTRYERPVAAAGVLIALASTVAAVAASNYSVAVDVPSTVVSGHSFSVQAHGTANQKALLYIYLDRKPCQATTDKEGPQEGVYKAGESYFWQNQGGHMAKVAWTYAWVSGSFNKLRTAHAGTVSGREYACAYLDRPNNYGGYRVTVAHASARYTVTK
jgi:hypothetical protein